MATKSSIASNLAQLEAFDPESGDLNAIVDTPMRGI
jgi:hypothetical protein